MFATFAENDYISSVGLKKFLSCFPALIVFVLELLGYLCFLFYKSIHLTWTWANRPTG